MMSKSERNRLILERIKETTERGIRSKSVAREILVSEGIYTPKGNLKKEFARRKPTKSSPKKAA